MVSTFTVPDLPEGTAPFSVKGMQNLFDAFSSHEEYLLYFGGEAHANTGAFRFQKKSFSSNPMAYIAESYLKTLRHTEFILMLPAIAQLPKEEKNYICACACRYLADDAFTIYLASAAAPAFVLTALDSGDPEYDDYYTNVCPPQELRNFERTN